MNALMNANPDIKQFFEMKMCKAVCDKMMEDYLPPFRFKVGQSFTLQMTFIDGEGEECWGESNYDIMEVDYDEFRVYINIEEDDMELFGNPEEEGWWLNINEDLHGNHYIQLDGTGYQVEWNEDRKITLENYKIEAKNTFKTEN